MKYHEVRIVAELRKQGEHERAEDVPTDRWRRRRAVAVHGVAIISRPLTQGAWCWRPENPAASCTRRSFGARLNSHYDADPVRALEALHRGLAIADLRAVLGDQTYESLTRRGESMTTSAMATYAYDQIDQARAELNPVS
jgi:hypothetical protein